MSAGSQRRSLAENGTEVSLVRDRARVRADDEQPEVMTSSVGLVPNAPVLTEPMKFRGGGLCSNGVLESSQRNPSVPKAQG